MSFVWDRDRAEWLADAMRLAASASQNEVSAVDVARAVFAWTDYPNGHPWSGLFEENDELYDEEDESEGAGSRPPLEKALGAAAGRHDLTTRVGIDAWITEHAAAIEDDHPSGRAKYQLIQEIEQVLGQWATVDDWAGSLGYCVPIVGFTADYARFRETDPNEIAIVQAAVRIGAREEDFIPRECELRFSPRDIVLVGGV